MEAAAAARNALQLKQLNQEVEQQNTYLGNLQQQLQQAQQQRDAAQTQLEAWRAQHTEQAPHIAELLRERQAWIGDLQKERAAASAAAAAAEVCAF